MNKRTEILETAKKLLNGDRQETHGEPQIIFQTIADLWSALIGKKITTVDVALMMAALKIARANHNREHSDNYIDGAGYLALGAELAEEKEALKEEPIPVGWTQAVVFDKGTILNKENQGVKRFDYTNVDPEKQTGVDAMNIVGQTEHRPVNLFTGENSWPL